MNDNKKSKKYFVKDEAIKNIENDFFRHCDIADNIVNIIETQETPYNIALIGKWGLGKSSIIELVKKKLNNPKKYKFHEINAWKYEKEALRRALSKQLFETIQEKKQKSLALEKFEKSKKISIENVKNKNGFWNTVIGIILDYLYNTVTLFLKLSLLLFIVVGLLTFILCKINPEKNIQEILSNILSSTFSLTLMVPLIETAFEKYLERNSDNDADKSISNPIKDADQYEDLLNEFLGNIKHKEIVIIDDLDRLSTSKIVEALDSIKAFSELKNILFIVPFDDDILRKAISETRGDENDSYIIESELFLDKLFQFKIYMPPLPDFDIKEYARKLCDTECQEFKKVCGDEYLDILNILVYPEVKTPRQVKKNINSFMNNMLISKKREKIRLQENITNNKSGKLMLAKLSVLQSDFNDFYEIVIKDFEIIEKFLKYYSLKEKMIIKNDNTDNDLALFFDKNGLKKEWLSLANFLILTADITTDNIGTYIFLTQNEVGMLIGDKKQKVIKNALLSGNTIYIKESLEKEKKSTELVIKNDLELGNVQERELYTIINFIKDFDDEFENIICDKLVNELYNKYVNKKINNMYDYTIDNLSELYLKTTQKYKIETIIYDIFENLDENSEKEIISKSIKDALNNDHLWTKRIKEKIKKLIENIIKNDTNNETDAEFYRITDLLKDLNVEEFNIEEYIDNECFEILFLYMTNGKNDAKLVKILNKKAELLIDLEKYEYILKIILSHSTNSIIIEEQSVFNCIEFILNKLQPYREKMNSNLCNDIALNLLKLDEKIIEKNNERIECIINLLEIQITEENGKEFDKLLSSFENHIYIPDIILKLCEKNEIKFLPILAKQINQQVFTSEDYYNIIDKLVLKYSDEQIKDLNAKISPIFTDYSKFKNEELPRVSETINCIIKNDKLHDEMKTNIKNAIDAFCKYYNRSTWAEWIQDIISFGFGLIDESTRKRYLDQLGILLKNETYELLAITGIKKISMKVDTNERINVLNNIFSNNISLCDNQELLEILLDDENLGIEYRDNYSYKLIKQLNDLNVDSTIKILLNDNINIQWKHYLEHFNKLDDDNFIKIIGLVKNKYDKSKEQDKYEALINIVSIITDYNRFVKLFNSINISENEIRLLDYKQVEELEGLNNLLRYLLEIKADKEEVYRLIYNILESNEDIIDSIELIKNINTMYYPRKAEKKILAKKLISIVNSTASQKLKDNIYELVKKFGIEKEFDTDELNEDDKNDFKKKNENLLFV